MPEIRWIDTAGLPAKYDIADLVDSGVVGEALLAWCRERVRQGPPPIVEAPAQRPKPRAVPAVASPGPGAGAKPEPPPVVRPAAPVASQPVSVRVTNVVRLPAAVPAPASDPDPGIPPEFSDDALSEEFSAKYSEGLRYVSAWGCWMVWDGGVWRKDDTLRAHDLARNVCRVAAVDCGQREMKSASKLAAQIVSSRTMSSVERLARSDRRHAATAKQWDADPWILSTPAGLIDLQTGLLRSPRPEDYCTQTTACSMGSPTDCPDWVRFLDVATQGNADLIEYMRRIAGYCMTGSVREHAFFFVYGSGGNGKGTFINLLTWLLGDYARVAPMQMFVNVPYRGHSQDLASLYSARLVTAQEVEEGKTWDEARIKALTGDDPITANFMHQNNFTFMPKFKLLFSGNHKPGLKNVDEAIKRRLQLIPFDKKIAPADKDVRLSAKLREQGPGILAWCLEGCKDWLANMLAPPLIVTDTTKEYFSANDWIENFFEQCLVFHRDGWCSPGELYDRYCEWSEQEEGERFQLPAKRFREALATRGITSERRGGISKVYGVTLKPKDDQSLFGR